MLVITPQIKPKEPTQIISEIQEKVLYHIKDMFQDELTRYTSILSVLVGNIGAEVAEKESAYRKLFCKTAKDSPNLSAAKVEILSKASDEYLEWNKAKAVEISVLETIKALKNRAISLNSERGITNNY